MRRVLWTIPIGGGLPVFGYGFFLMLGFVVGILLACRRAKKSNVAANAVMDISLISVVAGVIGARLAFLLLDYEPADGSWGSLAEWLAVWEGGLTFQGGLALALIADWVYLRCKKISPGVMFDIFAPSLAIGVGFGRLGCFLNGCCWGALAPAGSVFGIVFPPDCESMAVQEWYAREAPAMWTDMIAALGYGAGTVPPVPVYATQLMSAGLLFLIGAVLLWADAHWPRKPAGQLITWFLFLYAVKRFFIEYWRADTPLRYGFGVFDGLRLGQWLALVMFVAAVVLQIICLRAKKTENT